MVDPKRPHSPQCEPAWMVGMKWKRGRCSNVGDAAESPGNKHDQELVERLREVEGLLRSMDGLTEKAQPQERGKDFEVASGQQRLRLLMAQE